MVSPTSTSNGSKSRHVGNMFEYQVCKLLINRNIRPLNSFTLSKLERFTNNLEDETKDDSRHRKRRELVNQMLDMMNVRLPHTTHFEICHDNNGSNGNAADIVLHPSNIGLSLKNNNTFIKHQRCNKLYIQLGLMEQDAFLFKQSYQLINNKYVTEWLAKGLSRFNQIQLDQKFELYHEINALTSFWLSQKREYVYNYLTFVLSPNTYFVNWDARKKQLVVFKYNQLPIESSNVHLKITNRSILVIHYDNLCIKMRLHNASSRLTKTLSVKYSVTCNNKNMCMKLS